MPTQLEQANHSLTHVSNSYSYWFTMGLICGACMLATTQYAIQSISKAEGKVVHAPPANPPAPSVAEPTSASVSQAIPPAPNFDF